MRQFHVISLSVGTAILFCLLTSFLVLAIVFSSIDGQSKTAPSPNVFRPQNGAMGEIEHKINDLKYGPVNNEATKEVKNGLFDRIRVNRQARLCVPSPPSQAMCPMAVRTIDPSECTYSYTLANPNVGQTVITQSTGFEMPFVTPINPLDRDAVAKDCPTGKCPQRNAIKTGSFICSNCRKSQIGEWHTDWKDDGTPITFLCERCHSLMTPEQRENAYKGYIARQSKSAGVSGLLHQEIGQ